MRIVFIVSFALLASCSFRGIHYFSSASYSQKVPVGDVNTVTIRCYCPTYTVTREYERDDLLLDVSGDFSIVGYHGSAEDAGAQPLEPEELAFAVTKKEDSMVLDSKEWTYIHHAQLIDKLIVHAPADGVGIVVEQLEYGELEGRGQ